MDEEGRQTLREALPSATVEVLEGLGHNPFWEDPQAVAEVINKFVDGS
jgi:pimeloyl-ACP methyl ester carboxylesterase